MEMPGRKYNPQNYRYGFNGKENDRSGEWGLGISVNFEFREYDPQLARFKSIDPKTIEYPWQSPYVYHRNSPNNSIDYLGLGDPPTTLYHNTGAGKDIIESGFNATKKGKYSSYNWMSSTANATGTGRVGTGVTLGIQNIDISNAIEVTNKQMKEFYNLAKSELGYTSEQLRNSPVLRAEVDGLKFSKLGKWMDEMGSSVYKLGESYAISDAAANKGAVVSANGSSSAVKALNGLKVAGKVLMVVAVASDLYEIYNSENKARTITKKIGGFAGGLVASSSTGAALTSSGIDLTGPWGWVTHAGLTLGAGVVGYFAGQTVTEIVYDTVVEKGFSLPKKNNT